MMQDTMDLLLKLATEGGLEESEAFATESEVFSVSVLEGEIDDYTVENTAGISLRGRLKGHVGYAFSEAVDEEALQRLVEACKQNALLVQSNDEIPFCDDATPIDDIRSGKLSALTALTAQDKIALAKELEKLTKAVDERVLRVQVCGVGTGHSHTYIQNTLGLKRHMERSSGDAYVSAIVKNGEDMLNGFSFRVFDDAAKLDLQAIAKEAVGEALLYVDAKSMPSGSVPVVLRNDVMTTLLNTFAGVFSALAAEKGMSLLKGKEGEAIAAPCVTLIDDPTDEFGYISRVFDGEGVRAQKKALIENGVFNTLLYNLKSGKMTGKPSTGNASRGSYAATVGTAAANLYFAPGKNSRDELIAQAGNGVMITDLMGMHAGANSVSGDFSLAAKGVRIENGVLTHPVEQITVAGNFYTLLKGIRLMGSDLWFGIPGGACYGSASALVDGLSIAGK